MTFSLFIYNCKCYGTNNLKMKLILLPVSSAVLFCVLSVLLKHLCLGWCSSLPGVDFNFISFIAFGWYLTVPACLRVNLHLVETVSVSILIKIRHKMFLGFLYLLLYICNYYLVQASLVRSGWDIYQLLFVSWKRKGMESLLSSPSLSSGEQKEISTARHNWGQ